jgi:hypothetical protein
MDKGWGGTVYQNIAGIGGEFIFPPITFPLSLQLNFTSSEFNYPTLFDSFLYFIPRSIFHLKNYSINIAFSNMMDIGMGFASSPLLEAYINFGEYGYILEAILLCFILKTFTTIFNKGNNYLFYLFAYIYLIDLNRGEISCYIRQIIEMTVVINLCLLFINRNTTNYMFRKSMKTISF